MKTAITSLKMLLGCGGLAGAPAGALCTMLPPSAFVSEPLTTGEVQVGQSILEPGYDDASGTLLYFMTPNHVPLKLKPNTPLAPLYLTVYPNTAAGAIGTVSCHHQPVDNCPHHGPLIAGLAEAMQPGVYPAGGVWGHDHILSGHPAPPPAGGDFNVTCGPVVVLFTDTTHITHITTLSELQAAENAGYAQLVPLLAASFHCSLVSAAVYDGELPCFPDQTHRNDTDLPYESAAFGRRFPF
jgi:hypothetical protein